MRCGADQGMGRQADRRLPGADGTAEFGCATEPPARRAAAVDSIPRRQLRILRRRRGLDQPGRGRRVHAQHDGSAGAGTHGSRPALAKPLAVREPVEQSRLFIASGRRPLGRRPAIPLQLARNKPPPKPFATSQAGRAAHSLTPHGMRVNRGVPSNSCARERHPHGPKPPIPRDAGSVRGFGERSE
jgi:hypothetical protein